MSNVKSVHLHEIVYSEPRALHSHYLPSSIILESQAYSQFSKLEDGLL